MKKILLTLKANNHDVLQKLEQVNEKADKTKKIDIADKNLDKNKKDLDKVNKSYSSLIAKAAGGAAAFYAVKSAVSSIADSIDKASQSLLRFSEITTISEYNVKNLKAELYGLSSESGIDISAVQETAYQAFSASVDPALFQNVFGIADKLSKSTKTELDTTIDFLTTAANAYSYSIEEINTAANSAFAAVKNGKLRLEDLSSEMGKIASLAANMNVPLEEVLGLFASMTKRGVKAAIAATQIQSLLATFIDKNTNERLKKYGINIESLADSSDSFVQYLQRIYTGVNGNREALSEIIPRIEAFNGMISLTGENFSGAVQDFNDIMTDGVLDTAYEKMTNNAADSVNKIKNFVKLTGEIWNDSILSVFSAPINRINEWFSNLFGSNQRNQIQENINDLDGILYRYSEMNVSAEEKNRLISYLKSQYGQYVQSMDLEKTNMSEILQKIKEIKAVEEERLSASIAKQAYERTMKNELTPLYEKKIEEQRYWNSLHADIMKQIPEGVSLSDFSNRLVGRYNSLENSIEALNNDLLKNSSGNNTDTINLINKLTIEKKEIEDTLKKIRLIFQNQDKIELANIEQEILKKEKELDELKKQMFPKSEAEPNNNEGGSSPSGTNPLEQKTKMVYSSVYNMRGKIENLLYSDIDKLNIEYTKLHNRILNEYKTGSEAQKQALEDLEIYYDLALNKIKKKNQAEILNMQKKYAAQFGTQKEYISASISLLQFQINQEMRLTEEKLDNMQYQGNREIIYQNIKKEKILAVIKDYLQKKKEFNWQDTEDFKLNLANTFGIDPKEIDKFWIKVNDSMTSGSNDINRKIREMRFLGNTWEEIKTELQNKFSISAEKAFSFIADAQMDEQKTKLINFSNFAVSIAENLGTLFQLGMAKGLNPDNIKQHFKQILTIVISYLEKLIIGAKIAAMAEGVLNWASIGKNLPAIMGLTALFAAMKAAVNSFAAGGYTGDGGTYTPAGIVHAGEIVFEQSIVSKNKEDLMFLRSMLQKGYSLKDIMSPVVPVIPQKSPIINIQIQGTQDWEGLAYHIKPFL